jgi:hypothetical protein
MIIIKNRIIPFGKFKAITLWPFIFYKGKSLTEFELNHEKIHLEQQKELWLILFYIIYLYYAVRRKYKRIPFEIEAYKYHYDLNYLSRRKKFAWKKL